MQRAFWSAAFVIFSTAIAGAWGAGTWHDRQQTIDQAGRETEHTARILVEHAERAIDGGDRLLHFMVEHTKNLAGIPNDVGNRMMSDLRALTGHDGQIKSAWILDAEGTQIFNTWVFPPPPDNYASREYFQHHAQRGRRLHIGAADKGSVTGSDRFTLSRPIIDSRGTFKGVAAVAIYSSYFEDFYEEAAAGSGIRIGLFSALGNTLAAWPKGTWNGRATKMLSGIVRNGPGGIVQREGPDGSSILAYRHLPGAPALVVAELPLRAALSGWLRRAELSGLASLAVIMVFGFLTWRGLQAARGENAARKALEDAFALLEERVAARTAELEALYRDAPVGLGLVTGDLRIERANDRLREFLGDDFPKLVGRHAHDRSLAAQLHVLLARVLDTGEAQLGVEIRTCDGDAGERAWAAELYPVRLENGRLAAVGLVVREVTEEKRVQAALRTSEQRLRLAAEKARVFMGHCDRDLRYTWALNCPRGLSNEVLRGKRDDDLLPPSKAEPFMAVKRRVLLTGRGERCEMLIDTPGGPQWWDISVEPLFDDDGNADGLSIAALEATQRKCAEAALREREAELALIANSAPVLIAYVDTELRYRFVNQAYLNWFGRRWSDVVGRHISEVLGEQVYRTVREPVARALAGERVRVEATMPDRAGGLRHVRLEYVPRLDEEGRSIGYYAFITDITEQKANEERQALLMAELDHRVRNILASIQSMVALTGLSARCKDDYARALQGRVAAMARTHGLLTKSRWRGASLERILRDELESYSTEGEAVAFEGTVDCMLGAKEALNLALVVHELATNAAKYGALAVPGGRVTIAWDVETVTGETRLNMMWSETGVGKVEEPKTRGFGSRLIESALSSHPGSNVQLMFERDGVRCAIQMPLRHVSPTVSDAKAVAVPERTSPVLDNPHALAGMRVLLVEDEMLVAMQMRRSLTDAGAQVVGPAATVHQAMAMAEEWAPDAAVLDVNLNGEMVEPLAKLLMSQRVPFVFVTGYETATMLSEDLRDIPAIQKPAQGPEVVRMLASLTRRAAARLG